MRITAVLSRRTENRHVAKTTAAPTTGRLLGSWAACLGRLQTIGSVAGVGRHSKKLGLRRWTKRNNNRIRMEGEGERTRGLFAKQANHGTRCSWHVWHFYSRRERLGASTARRPARPGSARGRRRLGRIAGWLTMARQRHLFGLMRVTLLDAIGRTGASVTVQRARRLGIRRPMNQRTRREEGHAENEGR